MPYDEGAKVNLCNRRQGKNSSLCSQRNKVPLMLCMHSRFLLPRKAIRSFCSIAHVEAAASYFIELHASYHAAKEMAKSVAIALDSSGRFGVNEACYYTLASWRVLSSNNIFSPANTFSA